MEPRKKRILIISALVPISIIFVFVLAFFGTGGRLDGSSWPYLEAQAPQDFPVYPGSTLITNKDGLGVPQELRDKVSPFAKWYRFTSSGTPADVSVWYNQELLNAGFTKKQADLNMQIFSKEGRNVAIYIILIDSKTNFILGL